MTPPEQRSAVEDGFCSTCRHGYSAHVELGGPCHERLDSHHTCSCARFVPATEPAAPDTERACSICGDDEPHHVHDESGRIEDYFTVGRGQTDFQAAQSWKAKYLLAQAGPPPPLDVERLAKAIRLLGFDIGPDTYLEAANAAAAEYARLSRTGEPSDRLAAVEQALRELHRWASRMPDAGLAQGDPRYDWWLEGTEIRHRARALEGSDTDG